MEADAERSEIRSPGGDTRSLPMLSSPGDGGERLSKVGIGAYRTEALQIQCRVGQRIAERIAGVPVET